MVDVKRACCFASMQTWTGSGPLPDPVPGVWFFVDEDTPEMPYPHTFMSRIFQDPKENKGLGEQWERVGCCVPQPFYIGSPPAVYTGKGCNFTPEQWFEGGVWGVDPPLLLDANGRASCCVRPDAEGEGGMVLGGDWPVSQGGTAVWQGGILLGETWGVNWGEQVDMQGGLVKGGEFTVTAAGAVAWDGGAVKGGEFTVTAAGAVAWDGGELKGGGFTAGGGIPVTADGGELEGGAFVAGGGQSVTADGGELEGGDFAAAGHTAPSRRSFVNVGNKTGTWTNNKPTGTTSGDILIAFVYTKGTATLPTSGSGFAQIGSQTFSSTHSYVVFSKVAGGSEPTTYSWTTAAGGESSIVMVCVQNATTVEHGSNTNTGSGTGAVGLSVTPTIHPDYLLMGVGWSSNVAFPSDPSGMATVAGAGTNLGSQRVFDETWVGTGATGSRTATFTASPTWATILLNLYN